MFVGGGYYTWLVGGRGLVIGAKWRGTDSIGAGVGRR